MWYNSNALEDYSVFIFTLASKLIPIGQYRTLAPACTPFNGLFKRTILPSFLLASTDSTPSYNPSLHLCPLPRPIHFTLKLEAARSTETSVSYCNTTQCHNPEDCSYRFKSHPTDQLTQLKFFTVFLSTSR